MSISHLATKYQQEHQRLWERSKVWKLSIGRVHFAPFPLRFHNPCLQQILQLRCIGRQQGDVQHTCVFMQLHMPQAFVHQSCKMSRISWIYPYGVDMITKIIMIIVTHSFHPGRWFSWWHTGWRPKFYPANDFEKCFGLGSVIFQMMWKQSNFRPPPCLCCATGHWPLELATWHFSGKAQQAGWNWDNRNILRAVATLKSDQNWLSDFAKSLRNWDAAKIIVRISSSPEIYSIVLWSVLAY